MDLLMLLWPFKEYCYFPNWSGHDSLIVCFPLAILRALLSFAFLDKVEESAVGTKLCLVNSG